MSGFSETIQITAGLLPLLLPTSAAASPAAPAPPIDHQRAATAFSRVTGACFDKQAAIRNQSAIAVNVPAKNQSGAVFIACATRSTLFTKEEIALTVTKVWHIIADTGRINYAGEVAIVPVPPVTLANGQRYPGLTAFVGDSKYETRRGQPTGCFDNKLVIEVDDGQRTRLATGIYTLCPKAGWRPN